MTSVSGGVESSGFALGRQRRAWCEFECPKGAVISIWKSINYYPSTTVPLVEGACPTPLGDCIVSGLLCQREQSSPICAHFRGMREQAIPSEFPDSHPLSKRSVITPRDLDNVDFLALNPEDSSRHRLEAAMRDDGVELKIRVETPYAHTLCELALLGIGVGLVNPVAARDFLERGLIVKPFSVDVRFASLLVFRPGKPLPANARQFIRALRIRLEKDLKQLQIKLEETC